MVVSGPWTYLASVSCLMLLVGLSLIHSPELDADALDSGAAPYERCALCHGLFGNTPRSRFPRLAGQNPRYLEQQILHFREGRRRNDGGQMATVVTEIQIEDIPEIVEWFSSQTDPAAEEMADESGAQIYKDAGCIACHQEVRSPEEVMPLLYSQHPDYLAKQMRELREGLREGDGEGLMRQQLQALSIEDIDAVARHLGSMPRTQRP